MSGIPAVQNRLAQLRSEKILSIMLGDYKGFKQASKDFAKLAVNNFDELKSLPAQPKVTVPLFSKGGLRMMKVWFLEKFRVKTPDEKRLAQMAEREALRDKFIKSR